MGLLGAEPLALPRTCLDAMRLSWVENSTADLHVAPSPLFFPGGREETATEVCLPHMGATWKQTEAGLVGAHTFSSAGNPVLDLTT